MIGNPQEKLSLEVTNSQAINKLLEFLLAFGIGMAAYALHGIMKNPLGIPGHHGLVFMALIMTARLCSGTSFSGTYASLGAGSMMLMGPLGFSDPFRTISYMLPGIILDLLFLLLNSNRTFPRQLFIASLFGGLAYMAIPFVRILMNLITGYPYSSMMKNGPLIPLAGFFLFGMFGGLSGKFINQLAHKLSNP